MSGGHFGYIQHQIDDAANDILADIGRHGFSEVTYKKFQEAVELCRKTAIFINRIDCLICGDDSEESFHDRLANDLRENEARSKDH